MKRDPLPQLTIQQLDYLVTVADSPTWAAASERLGVTPSALSQGLAEVERRIGRGLFDRVGRRRVLAADTGPILDYAREVIARTTDLGRWLETTSEGASGSLRVGMIDVAAVGHFPNELRSFRQARPDIDFRLTVVPSSQLVEQVRRNELDLAIIVRPDVDPPDLETRPIITEALAVYGPPEQSDGSTSASGARRDAKRPTAPPSSWGPWVLFPTGSHTRALIERALIGAGATFDVIAESHQPDVLREMVRLGLGWTVLPVVQAEFGPEPLKPARIKPLVERSLVAVTRRGSLPNPLAEQLVELLRAAST